MKTENYQNIFGIKIKGTDINTKTLIHLKKETKSP